jgi:hypothetical protein
LVEHGFALGLEFTRTFKAIDVCITSGSDDRMIRGQMRQDELVAAISHFLASFISTVGLLIPNIVNQAGFTSWISNMLGLTEADRQEA